MSVLCWQISYFDFDIYWTSAHSSHWSLFSIALL